MKKEYLIPIMLMLLTCVGIVYTAIYSEPLAKRKDVVQRRKFIEDSLNEFYSIVREKEREEERIKQHADSLDMYKPYDFIEFREQGNNSHGFSLRFFKNGLIIWEYSSRGGFNPSYSETRYTYKKDSSGLLQSRYYKYRYNWKLHSEDYIDTAIERGKSTKSHYIDSKNGRYYFYDIPSKQSESFIRDKLKRHFDRDYHQFLIDAYLENSN